MSHKSHTKVYKKHITQTKMLIKTTTVRYWNQHLDQGDITKMADGNEVLRQKISKALNKRMATLETMEVINAFVEKKKAALKQIEGNATA